MADMVIEFFFRIFAEIKKVRCLFFFFVSFLDGVDYPEAQRTGLKKIIPTLIK